MPGTLMIEWQWGLYICEVVHERMGALVCIVVNDKLRPSSLHRLGLEDNQREDA
jgi:hypothetical protein